MPHAQHEKFAQIARRIAPEGRLRHVWALKGGVSAQVTALEVLQPEGGIQKMVVRQHGELDLKYNPNIAAEEFRLLRMLRSAGLPVPAPYYADQSGTIFPTPYIVVEYIEGKTELAPADLNDFTQRVAAQLTHIHQVDALALDFTFLPHQSANVARRLREHPAILDDALSEGRIREALARVWPLPRRNPIALLHGDYWPGNLLWHEGSLAAVIDWEDAALGDPLADLASSRLEMLWAFGGEAMQHFTTAYLSLNSIDCTHLAYWDLYAGLRPAGRLAGWALDTATENAMRATHHEFIAQAFARLPSF